MTRHRTPAPASDFTLDGDCRKIAGAVPIGARPGREHCEATLALARDISANMELRFAGTVVRERARGAGPVELGRPKAQYAQTYAATLAFAGGWSVGGSYFDRDGWRRGGIAKMARQMNVGDEEARRGVALSVGWSRAAIDPGGRPLDLSFVVDRSALGSLEGEPLARRATQVRLALDTRF